MQAWEFHELRKAVWERAIELENDSFDGWRNTRTETDCFKQACKELVSAEWREAIRVAAQGWDYYSGGNGE